MHLIIGAGKVGLPLSQLFHAANIPALATSRSGKVPSPLTGVAFDWNDPLTYNNAFAHAEASSDIIQSVFMTPPFDYDMLQAMKPFIELAKSKGVKRFVLLSAHLMRLGDEGHGAVHKYLLESGVEYAVIRPSWFYQNFDHSQPAFVVYADSVNGVVVSSTGSHKIGFVDTRDIAEAAFHAMTDEVSLNGSYLVFGPELLTYADVARIISSATGRSITHRNLTQSEFKEHAKRFIPESFAQKLTVYEAEVRAGVEERLFNEKGLAKDGKEKEQVWKGKRTLQGYIEEIKDTWME